MVKISEIINTIESFAPLSLSPNWDNSGWQIFLGDKEVDKVLVALTPTLDVIEQAVKQKFELIIAHHPLMFDKVNKLSANNVNDRPVLKAIQHNINVYSAHINLDSTKNGLADELAKLLDLKNLKPIEKMGEEIGLGRIGELEKEETLDFIVQKIKQVLKIDKLKLINPSNKDKIKTIGLCPGSGGDFIKTLKNIDLYITGDVKYHTAIEVNGMAVIDAGHFETERIILPVLKNLIEDSHQVAVSIAEEKDPWELV